MEKWIRWEPIEGLAYKYDIDYVLDSFHGFKIYLSDNSKKNKVEVNFKIA